MMTNTTSDVCPICHGDESVLVVDESGDERRAICQCVKNKVMKNRLKFAEVSEDFKGLKIKDFDLNVYNLSESREIASRAKQITKNFVLQYEKFQQAGKGLYFVSAEPGSGKTRLAVSLGNAIYNKYKVGVRFTTTIDLLGKIKDTFGKKSDEFIEDQERSQFLLIKAFRDIDVLILDDIGTEKQTPWVEEVLFAILNKRAENNKVTIYTSNCQVEYLSYSAKIRQRISRSAIPVSMPEESVRETLAKKENDQYIAGLLKGDL